MIQVTAAVEKANLTADVAILTELVAYLLAQRRKDGDQTDFGLVKKTLLERVSTQLAPLKNQSQQAYEAGLSTYEARATMFLKAVERYL